MHGLLFFFFKITTKGKLITLGVAVSYQYLRDAYMLPIAIEIAVTIQ
jgi:hypothetical protein